MKYTFFEYDASGDSYDIDASTLDEAIKEAEIICKDAGYDSNCKIRFAIQLNGETVYKGEYDYVAPFSKKKTWEDDDGDDE